jgi:hypothetical protein
MADASQETERLEANSPRRPARSRLLSLLVAGICGVGLLWVGLPEAFSPVGQWDFEAYYYALKVHDAGGNPYDHRQVVKMAGGAVNHLMYPPHTLAFFRLFAFDDLTAAKGAFLTAKLVCLAALLVLWTTWFVRAGGRGWFLAFAALGYNAAICRDLMVGNMSVFEQTLIWFGVFALMRGRLGLFCLLIILSAQFKILPVCLVGLVLLTDSRYKWHYFAGSIVACVLLVAGVYLWDPSAFLTYWRLLADVGLMEPGGVIHPCARTMIKDIVADAMKTFGVLEDLKPKTLAYPVYAVYALGVVLVYLRVVRRRMDLRTAVYLGMLTYAIAAPRMKDYSYMLLLVPTFELVRDRMTRPGPGRLLVFAVALLLSIPGMNVLWRYRSLVLAGWVWVTSLRAGGTAAERVKEVTQDPRG